MDHTVGAKWGCPRIIGLRRYQPQNPKPTIMENQMEKKMENEMETTMG